MLFKEASSSVEGAVGCMINRMKGMTLFQESVFIVISYGGIVNHKYLVGIPDS